MSDQFWFNKTSDPGPRNANGKAIREGCVADEAPVTCPGTLAANLSRCKPARTTEIQVKILLQPGAVELDWVQQLLLICLGCKINPIAFGSKSVTTLSVSSGKQPTHTVHLSEAFSISLYIHMVTGQRFVVLPSLLSN
jgi:hypothetical protein